MEYSCLKIDDVVPGWNLVNMFSKTKKMIGLFYSGIARQTTGLSGLGPFWTLQWQTTYPKEPEQDGGGGVSKTISCEEQLKEMGRLSLKKDYQWFQISVGLLYRRGNYSCFSFPSWLTYSYENADFGPIYWYDFLMNRHVHKQNLVVA